MKRKDAYITQILALLLMLTLRVASYAASPAVVFADTAFYNHYSYIRFVSGDSIAAPTADDFLDRAAQVRFPVGQATLPADSRTLAELEQQVLPRINADSLELVSIMIHGAASPDGSYQLNERLSRQRAQMLTQFIRERLRFPGTDRTMTEDFTVEDYPTLVTLMRRQADSDYATVKALCDRYLPQVSSHQSQVNSHQSQVNGHLSQGNITALKAKLQAAQGGALWRRLLRDYFPQLRTARIMLVFRKYEGEKMALSTLTPQAMPPQLPDSAQQPQSPHLPQSPQSPQSPQTPQQPLSPQRLPRRELLSLKTNLLFYGIYMPGYNRWCPIPNIALEYYPKRGHFTYGASFDMPWWQDYDAHKFFQLRNYQLHTRYYFRPSQQPLRPAVLPPGSPQQPQQPQPQQPHRPAFSGFFLQAYVNGGIYGICFDADRGWVGEGIGGGIGMGYTVPLSRNGHWRLDFEAQVGVFVTKYDPYQYENPIDPAYHDNLYYYKWTLDPDLFKQRQYRWTWIGPTRIGITLSYDLLYRRHQKRGASFKAYEYMPVIPEAPETIDTIEAIDAIDAIDAIEATVPGGSPAPAAPHPQKKGGRP